MRVVWDRLIRFIAADGRVLRGQPILPSPDFDLGKIPAGTKLQARVIVGNDIYDTSGRTRVSDEVVVVEKLLGPLAQSDIDILRCVGLNYTKHSMINSSHTNTKPLLNCYSSRSWSNSSTLSLHFLQAVHLPPRPRRRRCGTKTCPG